MRDEHLRQIQQILDNERNIRRLQNFDISDITNRARNPLLEDMYNSDIQKQVAQIGRQINDAYKFDIQRHTAQIDRQIQDSLKSNRHFSNVDKLVAELPKFDSSVYKDLDSIQKNIAKQDGIQKQLSKVISSIDRSFFDNQSLQNSFRQYENLAKSNLGTAVFASSLRQNEIDAIRQDILDRTRFAESKLSQYLSADSFEFLQRSKVWEQIDTLRDTFTGKLAIEFRDIFENVRNQQEAYDRISSIIEEKVSKSSQSGYTKIELMSLILSILALIVGIYSAALPTYQFIDYKKSGDEQKAQTETLVQLVRELVKNTAQDVSDHNQEIYYEVERKAQLKLKPSFSSITIGSLTPKSRVRIMFINHKWVYVESFNYLEGIPQYGWVNKKYLKSLK